MYTKRALTITSVICGAVLAGLSSAAMADDVTLSTIITAVQTQESAIQDLKIEYTAVRKPYGVDENWTVEQETHYPGFYMPESGVLTLKGNKIKLARTYYDTTSRVDQVTETIVYNGANTRSLLHSGRGPDFGVVSAGRWHGLRRWFNPLLAMSASGDMGLSAELATRDTEIGGLVTVNNVECRLVKLYKKTPSGAVLRSYKVYLDPARNYALIKAEKYWNNFVCLENVVEVTQLTHVGNVYVPTKATCVRYNRPSGKSPTSNAVDTAELTATAATLNAGVSDSVFDLAFEPGTKVRDSVLGFSYIIDEPQMP
jgi:hypothetical protein